MTDRILELARNAGAVYVDLDDYWDFTPAQLRKFAALVRREAFPSVDELTEILRSSGYLTWHQSRECAVAIRALAAQEGDK